MLLLLEENQDESTWGLYSGMVSSGCEVDSGGDWLLPGDIAPLSSLS